MRFSYPKVTSPGSGSSSRVLSPDDKGKKTIKLSDIQKRDPYFCPVYTNEFH
jgi:hypothetical protein